MDVFLINFKCDIIDIIINFSNLTKGKLYANFTLVIYKT